MFTDSGHDSRHRQNIIKALSQKALDCWVCVITFHGARYNRTHVIQKTAHVCKLGMSCATSHISHMRNRDGNAARFVFRGSWMDSAQEVQYPLRCLHMILPTDALCAIVELSYNSDNDHNEIDHSSSQLSVHEGLRECMAFGLPVWRGTLIKQKIFCWRSHAGSCLLG